MKIEVSGFGTNKRKLEKSLEKLSDHFGLDFRLVVRKLKVTSENKYGFAYYMLGHHGVCIFNDCPNEMLPIVISHEMIHVHQTHRGDLVHDFEQGIFWWKGQMFDEAKLNTMKYYDRPWEKEAKENEKKLAENFFI